MSGRKLGVGLREQDRGEAFTGVHGLFWEGSGVADLVWQCKGSGLRSSHRKAAVHQHWAPHISLSSEEKVPAIPQGCCEWYTVGAS